HRAVGIIKAALIGIDAPPMPKIVEVSDRATARGDPKQLDRTLGHPARDQRPMKALEKREAKGVRFAASRPRSDMQIFEGFEIRTRRAKRARFLDDQLPSRAIFSQASPQFLT